MQDPISAFIRSDYRAVSKLINPLNSWPSTNHRAMTQKLATQQKTYCQ